MFAKHESISLLLYNMTNKRLQNDGWDQMELLQQVEVAEKEVGREHKEREEISKNEKGKKATTYSLNIKFPSTISLKIDIKI